MDWAPERGESRTSQPQYPAKTPRSSACCTSAEQRNKITEIALGCVSGKPVRSLCIRVAHEVSGQLVTC